MHLKSFNGLCSDLFSKEVAFYGNNHWIFCFSIIFIQHRLQHIQTLQTTHFPGGKHKSSHDTCRFFLRNSTDSRHCFLAVYRNTLFFQRNRSTCSFDFMCACRQPSDACEKETHAQAAAYFVKPHHICAPISSYNRQVYFLTLYT